MNFGINVSEDFLRQASLFLNCWTELVPFKFLGILVGANPRRSGTWKPVLDKLRSRLACWKGRHLSIGGRVTLINSVLNSLPLYYFSFYKAPKIVIKAMIKIQRDFLWGVKEGNRGVYWAAWDKVCQPKKEGGLGIKNLEYFNLSLLAKWKWRFLVDHNACWRGLLTHRYGNLSSFMSNGVLRGHKQDSLWWRDLLTIGDAVINRGWLHGCIRRCLGEGSGILFWKHQWLGCEPLSDAFPHLFAGCNDPDLSVAAAGKWEDDRWYWEIRNRAFSSSQQRDEASLSCWIYYVI